MWDLEELLNSADTGLYIKYTENPLTKGEILTPSLVQKLPEVRINTTDSAFSTLIFFDIDAPLQFRPVLHWLLVNIPGSSVEKGDTRTEYLGSAPGRADPYHRYVFALFKQQGKINIEKYIPMTAILERTSFNLKAFVERHQLTLEAVTYFKATWDEVARSEREKRGLPP